MGYTHIPPKPLSDFANQSLVDAIYSVYGMIGGAGSPKDLFTPQRWTAIVHVLLSESMDRSIAFLYVLYMQEMRDKPRKTAARAYCQALDSPFAQTDISNVARWFQRTLKRVYLMELKLTPTSQEVVALNAKLK